MEQPNVIHSRNKFIILFLTCSVIMHLLFIPYLNNSNEFTIAISGLFYSVGLLIFHRKGTNPFILRIFIVAGCNMYVFAINLLTPDQAHLLYLIFPLFLTAVYNTIWLNVFVTLLTGVEVAILFSIANSSYFLSDSGNLLPHFVSILVTVVILCMLYVLKVGSEWNTMSIENERMDTILSSKAGYLELFFKHANDGIAVFGLDGKILVVNPAFEKMYGWKQVECVGKCPRFYPTSEDEHAAARTRKVLQGHSYHDLRSTEMRSDGTLFDAELTIAPIYDESNKLVGISFISRDITHKLQAEKLKLDSEKLKGMGEVAASVAHEVRNPLTSISGFIQLMVNDPANPYQTYKDIISNEMKRIDLIVGEFLVLSKPSLQETNDFYIEETILNVIQMFHPETSSSSIVINFQQPEEKHLFSGNEYRLKQVFINLLKNSCEALIKNGIITIKTAYQNDKAVITITDNGPGMDQDTIQNLYEPFYTTKPEGTGLGMMISKKIIVDHHGTMTVASKKNEGTETIIKLPCIQ